MIVTLIKKSLNVLIFFIKNNMDSTFIKWTNTV